MPRSRLRRSPTAALTAPSLYLPLAALGLVTGERFFRKTSKGGHHSTLCTWCPHLCSIAEKDPPQIRTLKTIFRTSGARFFRRAKNRGRHNTLCICLPLLLQTCGKRSEDGRFGTVDPSPTMGAQQNAFNRSPGRDFFAGQRTGGGIILCVYASPCFCRHAEKDPQIGRAHV